MYGYQSHHLQTLKQHLLLIFYRIFYLIIVFSSIAPLVESDKETDEQNYLLWRLEGGVAEGSTEIPKGITFLLNPLLSPACCYTSSSSLN